MLRLTIKNLAANRLRFALTAFAVVLAVSFVVSSFVLTDGLRSSFNALSADIVGGTDFEMRGEVDEFGNSDPVDESLLDEAAAVDGVAAVAPVVLAEGTIRPINADGEPIPPDGPPQLAFGWVDDERLSSFTVVEGEAPDEAGEFTMDRDAATTHGFAVGQTYDVITPQGSVPHTLTGLVSFGEDNATLGATLMLLELEALQDLTGADGYESVVVAVTGGADRAAVEAELAALDPAVEVVDNTTLESEQRAEFNGAIDIVGNVLLGFAGISLFVSIFIIYNTFAIVLGQRTKELALLRTVGADAGQLRRSVLGEAAAIGVGASGVGVAGGIGAAYGLRALFGAIGAQLPDSPVIVSSRTVVVAVVVGLGVTVLSALGPARKASLVPPLAALRDGAAAGQSSGRTPFALGAMLAAAGGAAGAYGLFGAGGTATVVALLATGAIAVFLGVTLVSPVAAGLATRLLGWPASQAFGVSGRLAQLNAGRNPRRTATTAAALMIGLAMVSMALTVGESVKTELRSTLESSVSADYLVIADDDSTFPTSIAAELDALPQTDAVASFRYDQAKVGDEVGGIVGTNLAETAELFDLELKAGATVDDAVADPVLVSDERAEADGITIGDPITMTFTNGEVRTLTVIGVFGDDIVVDEDFLLDVSTWTSVGADPADAWVAASLVEGVTEAEAEAAFARLTAEYPLVSIDTANDYVRQIEGQVDQLLAVVNAMMALAVVIALIGIANTLALSVLERTRELGLLRAVGMTRRQLRRMVRFEAALVALFGAALGVAVGVVFGWAAVAALPAEITSTLAVPVVRIAILVGVAGGAGLLAALGPARRAARLDVLEAIAA